MAAYPRGQGRGINWLREHVGYSSDNCLTWPFGCDDKGYGTLGHNRKIFKAARMMCELVNGPPPAPKIECAHSCGRGHKGCVNPRHLSWKTRSANQLDRRKHGTHGKPGCVGRSKLTPDQISRIRALAETKTHKALALQFNCTPSNISKILSGARWKKTPSWLKAGITRADLDAIRTSTEAPAVLAARYGVSRSVIWRIQNTETYRHVS
jgi:hypothetical protein